MTKKLTKRDVARYRKTIGSAWNLSDPGECIVRTFHFQRFVEAFMFVTRIGIHAEVMHQYPCIVLNANLVTLTIGDTAVTGLTPENFELAKKIDVVYALSTVVTRE